jgi:hypothetical protein
MSQLESICVFLIIITMLLGIILGISFRKKRNTVVGIIFFSVIIIGTSILVLYLDQKSDLNKTIKAMIQSHGGVVISVNKVEGIDTPFGNEVLAYNSVYEVKYRIEGKYYTAWYRSTDLLATNMEENIDDRGRHAAPFYREAWIFNE